MSSKRIVWCLWYQDSLNSWTLEGIYCDKPTAKEKLEKLKKTKSIIDFSFDKKYVRYTA